MATVLHTDDDVPEELRQLDYDGWHVDVHKSTYPANNPSEDRSTLAVDKARNTIFAGVWDGHGGTKASDFAEEQIWPNFSAAMQETHGDVESSFKRAYRKADQDYIRTGRERQDPSMLLTGTCAVAAYVDMRSRHVVVGNLGDSRAVVGVYDDGYITAHNLSEDHSASTDSEKYRLRNEHPMDSEIIVEQYDDWKGDYDCVVKGVTRFTRSIGDAHMKDKTCAKLFNSYRCGVMVEPLPRKSPYISNEADVKGMDVENGFVIVACDGIWDEMSSDEAVHLCQHLFVKHEGNSAINIADEFLQETLKKATARLQRTDPDEENLTLEELRRRPLGKQGRSMLHDDLTCIILRWRSSAAPQTLRTAGLATGGRGWGSIKQAVKMHNEIKHRRKLKWARLMDDMMLMLRQEREGQPSILTSRILSQADEDEDEDDTHDDPPSLIVGKSSSRGSSTAADLTRAIAVASQAAMQAVKASTSAELVGRSGDPDVAKAAAQAANAAAAAANQASAAAAAAAAAATTAAQACEAMARACGVDLKASLEAGQEAKD